MVRYWIPKRRWKIINLQYSKTCVKQPLSKIPKIGFQDQLSLNAGQNYCRMEHSAILSTFIKLPFVIKIFLLSIFEWPFYAGFTVSMHPKGSIIVQSVIKCFDGHRHSRTMNKNVGNMNGRTMGINKDSDLTLCLLMSSADNLCKQLGPRSGGQRVGAWSGSKLFDTDGIPERIYRKGWFKKNQ